MSTNSMTPEIITMRIPSRLELLSVVDSVTCSVCERMKFDGDSTSLVSMSVIEAGTNAIQHGHHRDATIPVDIEFQIFPDRLEVQVQDRGHGFDIETITGDITTPEHLLDARGRGIYIMRACMDTVDFRFSEIGTLCRLTKRLPAAVPTG